jgi:hypothetical protein
VVEAYHGKIKVVQGMMEGNQEMMEAIQEKMEATIKTGREETKAQLRKGGDCNKLHLIRTGKDCENRVDDVLAS